MSRTSEIIGLFADAARSGNVGLAQTALQKLIEYREATGAPLEEHHAERLLLALRDSGLFKGSEAGHAGRMQQAIARIVNLATPRKPDLPEINAQAELLYEHLRDVRIPFHEDAAVQLIGALRKARAFEWLGKISDRLLWRGIDMGRLHTYYAQALIDTGRMHAAVEMLVNLLASDSLPREDRDEANGLLGRAYKQVYVNHIQSSTDAFLKGRNYRDLLQAAYDSYLLAYHPERPGENYWHGINAIAIAKRAEKDGIDIRVCGNVEDLARRMIAALLPKVETSGDAWLPATIGEAYLAIGDYEKAAEFMAAYAGQPDISSFALEGTIRQLEEVWRIEATPDGPGKALLVLKAAVAEEPDGEFRLTRKERAAIRNMRFETAVHGSKTINLGRLKRLVTCSEPVAWIKSEFGEGVGTGFLVRGSDLSEQHLSRDKIYLMTNSHVLWDFENRRFEGEPYPLAVPLDKARVFLELADSEFGGGGGGELKIAKSAKWQAPPATYDAILIEVECDLPPHVVPVRVSRERRHILNRGVFVAGHAGGSSLCMLLIDPRHLVEGNGKVVDYGPRHETGVQPHYIHYDASTLEGNSGSPVFDANTYELEALHHAGYDPNKGRPKLNGKPGYNLANEGICIHSIKEKLRQDLSGLRRSWSWMPPRAKGNSQ